MRSSSWGSRWGRRAGMTIGVALVAALTACGGQAPVRDGPAPSTGATQTTPPVIPPGNGGGGGGDELDLEDALNAWLQAQYPDGYPAGAASTTVSTTGGTPPTVDTSDTATSASGGSTPVWSDSILTPTVEAGPGEDIDAVCIGFGSIDDAWCIPSTDPDVAIGGGSTGYTTGPTTATLSLTMPPALCADLSQICHDIKCYEFAQTDYGTFTTANVAFLAAACGGCDEPSCRDLVGDCAGGFCLVDTDCATDDVCFQGICVGSGDLRFTMGWSAANTDFDLHVTTPSGAEISFENTSADGGLLDEDNTSGGPNSLENVFFTGPLDGTYEVWVHLFGGDGGAWTLSAWKGTTQVMSESGTLVAEDGESPHFTVTYP